jgi:adenylate cyclase
MALEIEGKWLLSDFDTSKAAEKKIIMQGYVAQDPNGNVLRVRQSNDTFTFTVKGKASAGAKVEVERTIDKALFDELWPLTEGRRVEKIRHLVPLIGSTIVGIDSELVAEVDVFSGRHEGLIMAEIEVPELTLLTALRSAPPAWFGEDVTENSQYSNSWLAENGMPTH